jgi:hypothetical protein
MCFLFFSFLYYCQTQDARAGALELEDFELESEIEIGLLMAGGLKHFPCSFPSISLARRHVPISSLLLRRTLMAR